MTNEMLNDKKLIIRKYASTKIGILHWIIISYIYIFSVFLKLKIDSLHLILM